MIPELFKDIPWGTGEVLKRTIEVAKSLALPVSLLEPLDDVDRPEDLHLCETFNIDKSVKKNTSYLSQ